MDEAEARAKLQAMVLGEPGTPVPEVDPLDIKSLWEYGEQLRHSHPEGGVATGMGILEHLCKPGAEVKAAVYRANQIGMLLCVAPEVMEPLIQDKRDAVLQTAATIPMKWIGLGVTSGWMFNPDDFIRRVNEA
jgi:hypothetical protein